MSASVAFMNISENISFLEDPAQDANLLFEELMKISVPPQFVVTKLEQNMDSTFKNWGDVFGLIGSKHWHTEGSYTCPHTESLLDHLKECGQICLTYAIKLGYSPLECKKAYFAGLLHDIGKPGTQTKTSKYLAFKGHGIVGGALIEALFSPELTEKFGLSLEDWGDISGAADVHMCSYFGNQTSPIHKQSACILPDGIKNLLSVLSIGDQLAMVPSKSFSKTKEEVFEHVMSSHEEYVKTLKSPFNPELLNKKQGVLVFIQGNSSSGKTSLALKLLEIFGDKAIWSNRDFHMVRQTMKYAGKKPIESYKEMTVELYQKCYTEYINSKKAWASQINNSMCREIGEALQLGKIVFVDTLAAMYDSVVSILPDNAIHAYRMAFWVHRNQKITEAETAGRLGMSLPLQLSIHGEKSLLNPLPPKVNWFNMTSATESGVTEKGDLKEEPYQAHLSISIGWTGAKTHIVNQLCDKMKEIYMFNQSIPKIPILNQTYAMTLIELVQTLNDIGGLEAIVQFFTAYSYTVNRYIPGVVGIKYIDGVNQIWQPAWSREARGRFYYIGSKKVVELKSALQRGIEVLTKAHMDMGIKATQDVDPKAWDIFDDNQRAVLKSFSGSNEYAGYLSGKVDGSLLIINVIPVGSEQYKLIADLALAHGDEFTKAIVSYCIENGLDLVTVSTQGTLFIGPDMQDYFITAIEPLIGQKISVMADWSWVVPIFVTLVLKYYKSMNTSSMVNYCFEAYCKNRTTITGKEHTELAIGYDHSGFNLLGMMCDGNYVPHFKMPRHTFIQPIFIHVSSTNQVFQLMKELDEVVMGARTKEQFLSNFVIDEFTAPVIQFEGFVLLTQLPDGRFDYAKYKAGLYYKCHKVHKENIKELCQLPPSCSEHYPIIKKMKGFFDGLDVKLEALVNESFQVLESQINKRSSFYKSQPSKAQARWDVVIDAKIPEVAVEHMCPMCSYFGNPDYLKEIALKESALKEYAKNKETIFRMMLNVKDVSKELVRFIGAITTRLFNLESEELMTFVKNLFMKIEPWKVDWQKRLAKLLEVFDEAVNELYAIVVGFSL